MGSVVGESLGQIMVQQEHRGNIASTGTPMGATDLRVLARTIIDKEPSEIRNLLSRQPEMVTGWVSQLKTQQLNSAGTNSAGLVDELRDAMDHIRLSTLSPLKFAAE